MKFLKKIIFIFLIPQLFALSKPQNIFIRYGNVIFLKHSELHRFYNDLSAEEKIFLYYMFRAALPMNRVFEDQRQRHILPIIDFFSTLWKRRKELKLRQDLSQDISDYLVLLWVHHGNYLSLGTKRLKFTPQTFGLNTITADVLRDSALQLGIALNQDLLDAIFDKQLDPYITVAGDIEKSAVNIYSADFKNSDFVKLPQSYKNSINSRLSRKNEAVVIEYYKSGGRCSKELDVAIYWLQKAYDFASKHSQFDRYMTKSLYYMIKFLRSGAEKYFKKHSIAWIKSASKIDYCFGFIESYFDPKSIRCAAQADITIKTPYMDDIKHEITKLGEFLPFPSEYKNDLSKITLNPSLNVQVFASGYCGALHRFAGYCLPNDNLLKATYGSKQIIYYNTLGRSYNSTICKLFNSPDHLDWKINHDASHKLDRAITLLQVVLHETLGHSSGKSAFHRLQAGDILPPGCCVGDTIPVTEGNIYALLQGHFHTIEELRAELIALYMSIINAETLKKMKLFAEIDKGITTDEFIDECIINILKKPLFYFNSQPANDPFIRGAHAQASAIITNYLIAKKVVGWDKNPIMLDGNRYTSFDIKIYDRSAVVDCVKKLLCLVQEIKSTANGILATDLIQKYSKVDVADIASVQSNFKVISPKAIAFIYPDFYPISDEEGLICDIEAVWPVSVIEQYVRYSKMALSKE